MSIKRLNFINKIILVTLFLFLGCAQKKMSEGEEKIIQYLALGDSYTIGESVDESQRFPVLLANKLREEGYQINNPEIIAKTGWTTDELSAAIKTKNITGTYDLVSLLIGVNNQYRGRDVNNYRIEFRALLQKAIDFTGGQPENVFVLSIPDWGVTPFASSRDSEKIAKEIDLYNEVNHEESKKRGILYLDITPISRQAKEKQSLIAEDGLHPSGKMYVAWVDLVLPGVKTILNKIKK